LPRLAGLPLGGQDIEQDYVSAKYMVGLQLDVGVEPTEFTPLPG
jgi:hypothetical protein